MFGQKPKYHKVGILAKFLLADWLREQLVMGAGIIDEALVVSVHPKF